MAIRISSALLEQIGTMAAAEPTEICGLLLGGTDRIDAILRARNVAPDPRRHFEIDPATLIASHRAARRGGPAIAGYFHSHPSGDPVPSVTDAANAAPDGMLWLIVGGGRIRLWQAEAGEAGEGGATAFREVPFVAR